MKTKLVWVLGRHNGGGYKMGVLYVVLDGTATKSQQDDACRQAVEQWCTRHAVSLVKDEVAR